jgi:hypothetical protein
MAFELCWASRDERRRRLPGDDLVPHPRGTITHAITIDAPPEAVWPLLIQMGSGRAGWYSFDHIDNGGMPSARQIIPELQHVTVGDIMPCLPGAQDVFKVEVVMPGRVLILVAPLQPAARAAVAASGSPVPALRTSWALVVERLDHGRTRLIARGRISDSWLAVQATMSTAPSEPFFIERVYGLLAKMPWPLLLPVAEFGHSMMESRMLRGIKRRAERCWAEERASANTSRREEVHP